MALGTIDVGIDLGTTNSAIARLQQGVPFIVPNNEGSPTTPSCVRINKTGTKFIGKTAYEHAVSDPGNTAIEFKRWMGTDYKFTFDDAQKEMTAPELSALILQSLRTDLAAQGETTAASIITVPAAFDLNQCAATQEAGKLAGLEHAPLLQEPIAASLAFGYRLDLEGRHWLVYDLGGGTFDLALVGVRDGRVQVIDHAGDNHLGGKDFDWLLVERILVPQLGKRYKVASFRRDNPDHENRLNMKKLKSIAESAKVRLSREETTIATIETSGKPMIDDSGDIIEIDISVPREEYEAIITPILAKTVELSRQVIERNPTARPEAVLMVGGPTLTPVVRRMVNDTLGTRVDTSANPLTVVAEGAAWYGATQPIPDQVKRQPRPQHALALDLMFKALTDDDSQLVGCKANDTVVSIEFTAADKSWSSGQLALTSGTASVRLPLPNKGPHHFSILARDASGQATPVEPNSLTITRGLTAAAAPLSRSLGVVVEERSGEQEVQWLLQKNAPLPALGRYEFRTTLTLEPGGEIEIIQIYIVEGEGDNLRPQRQRSVGELTITDRHVPRTVPAGNPIEVRIAVDQSRILSAEAYLPLVDQTFSAQIELKSDSPESQNLEEAVAIERTRLGGLAQHVPATTTRELHEALREAEHEAAAAAGGDPDTAQRALRMLQKIQVRIDEVEDGQRLPMAIAEAREESEITNGVVMEYGDEGHKARVRALVADLDEAVATGSVSEVRRAESKLTRLKWELLVNRLDWWAGYFAYMANNITGWTDSTRAQRLIQDGRAAVVREDLYSLREVCFELRSLVRVEDERKMGVFQNVGIRR